MKQDTSWNNVHKWYDEAVGKEGHYYHTHVIIPNTLKLLSLPDTAKILDLACGQGVLARNLPKGVSYLGVDASSSLIKKAREYNRIKEHNFLSSDLTLPLKLKETFTHSTVLMAIQNIEKPLEVLKNAYQGLDPKGKLLLVLNHPCFRIPRQSSWQIDEPKKLQYRRVDRYMTPMTIPILTHPGQQDSPKTLSFHYPLSSYTKFIKEAGFSIDVMEEWCSTKRSVGKAAAMENRSREEFPLFLAILARKP